MIGAMVIGGDKFSGKPGDWADVKPDMVSAIETAGYSYITKMGAYLFSVAGSVNAGCANNARPSCILCCPCSLPLLRGGDAKEFQKSERRCSAHQGQRVQAGPQDRHYPIDNPTLARILVSYQKPLEIKEGELVEPIGVRRNKNRTYVECKFISPEPKAEQHTYQMILHGDWEVFPPLFFLAPTAQAITDEFAWGVGP
jgi:hypothetical protein